MSFWGCPLFVHPKNKEYVKNEGHMIKQDLEAYEKVFNEIDWLKKCVDL